MADRKNIRIRARVDAWLKANDFIPAQLEAECDDMSRQTLQNIRAGADVRLSTARRVRVAASKLKREPVPMHELFDLGDEDVERALAPSCDGVDTA